MERIKKKVMPAALMAVVAVCVAAAMVAIAAEKESPVGQFMKTYHKAPKGVDPVCKKAQDGKATPEEIKKLVEGYKMMTTAKPSKGDDASWKEKTGKLFAAAQGLEKGGPDAIAKYKEAVNCKACHSMHRGD